MTLQDLVETYIAARQSLGTSFTTDARTLRRFLRKTGDVPLEDITQTICRDFYERGEPCSPTSAKNFRTLRGLFRFAIARRLLTKSPLPIRAPRVVSSFRPHIYSIEELRRLLQATSSLADKRSPLQHATFRAIILLLYAAGLRAGEALRLTIADVDLKNGLLRIRDSKFSKSREIPISESLCAALHRYRARRCNLPMPLGSSESAFFATRTGHMVSLDRLERVFRKLRIIAQLLLPDVKRRSQPRLHDLRHTFAVHRLLAWYQEGADMQQRLPWLSMYLGHRNLAGTQVYLSLTPAVLEAASSRFAAYAKFGAEVTNG